MERLDADVLTVIRRRVDALERELESERTFGRTLSEQLARARRERESYRTRTYELQRSRALWKKRAQAKHGSFGRSTGRPTHYDKAAA